MTDATTVDDAAKITELGRSAPTVPAHYSDLSAVESTAWALLVRGANARKSAFHQATVATVNAAGLPEARTVVLRAANAPTRSLRFHTDIRSGKVAEFAASPSCVIHFYDHGAKIQLRVRAHAHVHHKDDVTAPIWQQMRDMSKVCYRQPIGPGEPIEDPTIAETSLLGDDEAFANFVVVKLEARAMEWLYLAAAGHRRAEISYAGGPQEPPTMRWLAP
ncbi:MAG: pyridoxamine 5'-phosphate oxidase family protein [Pseudomonadota bacterium]